MFPEKFSKNKEHQGEVASGLTMRNTSRTNERAGKYNLNLKSTDLYPLFVSFTLSLHSHMNFGTMFHKFFLIQKVTIINSFNFHYAK